MRTCLTLSKKPIAAATLPGNACGLETFISIAYASPGSRITA